MLTLSRCNTATKVARLFRRHVPSTPMSFRAHCHSTRHILLLVVLLPLLLGCAAVEVRVVDGGTATATAEGENSGETRTGEEQTGVEAGEAEEVARVDPNIEGTMATAVAYLTLFAEACAAVVIAAGVVRAAGQFVRSVLSPGDDRWKDDLRIRLGRSLAVGLEFGLAADILKTAIAPTWEVIAELAAIVVLRTLLNYFLEREMRNIEARRGAEV